MNLPIGCFLNFFGEISLNMFQCNIEISFLAKMEFMGMKRNGHKKTQRLKAG